MLAKLNTVTVFMIAILILPLVLCNQSVKAENPLGSGKFVMINPGDTMLETAEIFQKGNRICFRLSNDFLAKKEPDLRVLLHKQSCPEIQNDYAALRNLKNLKGTQVYETPKGVALDGYAPIVVWFRKLNVGFGIAKLNKLER